MPEKVLNNPLSGEEIRNAVLNKIGIALKRDCFLSPNLAYDHFECHVTISLKAHDLGRVAEVNLAEHVTQGVDPTLENPDILLEQADAEFDIDPAPPNEVRVETGQDVPVQTKNADGKSVTKGIRYSKKQLAKAR